MAITVFSADQPPLTEALRAALAASPDRRAAEDLMFLEAWERQPLPGCAAALRILQIRRANPALAASIRAELAARGTNKGPPAPRQQP